jgi:glyoxylase-like metal-dependent hydrolase (beta-lactamase superfamily II)
MKKITQLLFLLLVALFQLARADTSSSLQPVQVAPSTWYVQGVSALGSPANRNFISNAGFVVTAKSVVVIDALGSPELAEELLARIKEITPNPVTHVIVTHYHADHVYGLQTFKSIGATIFAEIAAKEYINSETAVQRLKDSRLTLSPWVNEKTVLTPATQWLSGKTTLVVDGVKFEITPVGEAHTPEDLVIYVPSEKVLFAGDVVFKSRIPYVGPTADTQHWVKALDELIQLDVKTIVPGHGPATDDAEVDLVLARDYLRFLRHAMEEGARNLDPFDEVYNRTDWSAFQDLPLFKVANRMNAYNTYIKISEEKE